MEEEELDVVLVFIFDEMIDFDCDCSVLFGLRNGEDVDDIDDDDRDGSEGASVSKLTEAEEGRRRCGQLSPFCWIKVGSTRCDVDDDVFVALIVFQPSSSDFDSGFPLNYLFCFLRFTFIRFYVEVTTSLFGISTRL